MEITLVSIGNVQITLYALAVFVSVCAANIVVIFGGRKNRIPAEGILLVCTLDVIFGIFFGHLLFSLVKILSVLPDYGALFLLTPWRGGYMFYGVILGTVLAAALSAGKCRIESRKMFSCIAPALMLLAALLKLAAPLCGQGYGPETEIAFFPISYATDPEWPEWRNIALFFWAACYYGVCFLLMRRGRGKVALPLKGLILYCAGTVLLESLRRDNVVKWGFIRVPQLISAVILFLIVLYGLYRTAHKGKGILRTLGFAALTGAVIALEFSVDKPLHLPGGGLYYFPLWLTYSLMAVCAALMGVLAYVSSPRTEKQ